MTTLVLSILNGSSSFLHTIRTTIKAWISLNFVKIPSHILELAPLECHKNSKLPAYEHCEILFSKHYAGSQASDHCPLGYLFSLFKQFQ